MELYKKCKICGVFCRGDYCPKHDAKQRKLNLIIREDEALKNVLEKARNFGFDDEEKAQIRRLIEINSK
jgi:recombinational DNA repair protein RecR